MKNKFFVSVLVGTILLSLVSALVESLFGRELSINYLLWTLVSNFLIVSCLGLIVKHNTLTGWKLSLFIFSIYFVIGHFNLLIEAYIFKVTDAVVTGKVGMQGLMICLISSPILVKLFGRWDGVTTQLEFPRRSKGSWILRIALGDLLYVFFYLAAGMVLYLVYPQLMDFYGDKVPPFSLMISTQFVRALIFIGIAILISRRMQLPMMQRALLIGAFFAIVGGLAPLIVPENEHMPDYIRFGHAFEVGISNSLFGFLLTWLVGQKTVSEKLESEVKSIA